MRSQMLGLKSEKWTSLFCSGDLARVMLTGRRAAGGARIVFWAQESDFNLGKIGRRDSFDAVHIKVFPHFVNILRSSVWWSGWVGGTPRWARGGRVGWGTVTPRWEGSGRVPACARGRERAPLVAQSANCRPLRLGWPRAGYLAFFRHNVQQIILGQLWFLFIGALLFSYVWLELWMVFYKILLPAQWYRNYISSNNSQPQIFWQSFGS